MSKRVAEQSDVEPVPKRSKLHDHIGPTQPQSVEHLHELLSFRQDALPELVAGTKSFKAVLDAILYSKDDTLIIKQQTILHNYLEHETPRHDDDLPLKQLIQAWSFAAQINHDSLCSALPALFALLLKTISSILELRDFGLALSKALLRDEQLKLLARNLGASKEKEHLISPCLRLLNEITIFDGGSLTSRIHACRYATLDQRLIARCLSLGRTSESFHESGVEKPSVRANCIRYLLSLLKFSAAPAKDHIIRSAAIAKALFANLSQDSPTIVIELLHHIKEYVLQDSNVDRLTKSHFLNNDRLLSISVLYRTIPHADPLPANQALLAIAHDFLLYACTTTEAGILGQSSGFYPPGTERHDPEDAGQSAIYLGLDSISWYNDFDASSPVNNHVLSRFVKSLKPYVSHHERELVISIFEACPELVADYFRSTRFSFDPKLTATWVNYTAFLFCSLRTKIPPNFGRRDGYSEVPPPISILMESVLPTPMNQKILIRCLNQSSELVSFSTVGLLLASLQKLSTILSHFDDASKLHGSLWEEARDRLMNAFTQRFPSVRDVVTHFHKRSRDHSIHYEAVLRLLRRLYEVTPQLLSEYKFDVSLPLDAALSRSMTGSVGTKTDAGASDKPSEVKEGVLKLDRLQSLELGHLLSIASHTPDTRWFHKPESLPFSPFTCLLKVNADSSCSPLSGSYELLASIAENHDVLRPASLDALVLCLQSQTNPENLTSVLKWIDDVVQRYIKRPIKYQDDLDVFCQPTDNTQAVSPFWMALLEQWPFAVERRESAVDIAKTLHTFLLACQAAGDDAKSLAAIHVSLQSATRSSSQEYEAFNSQDTSVATLKKRFDDLQQRRNKLLVDGQIRDAGNGTFGTGAVDGTSFELPQDSSETNASTSLHMILKSSMSDLTEAITSGLLSQSILCLSSADDDVRKQARASLHMIAKKLSQPSAESAMPSAKQIWLLLGILENTIADATSEANGDVGERLPYAVTAFASMAAPILANPTNPLFEQVNKFLLRGPVFPKTRILSYWRHDLLRRSPPESAYRHGGKPPRPSTTAETMDGNVVLPTTIQPLPLIGLPPMRPFRSDPHHNGIHFLLSYLYHATCTDQDLAILRRSSDVLESILALAGSDVFLPRGLRELAIAILWRITCLDDGSTMLITRAGVVSWLTTMIDRRGAGKGPTDLVGREGLKQLLIRIWDTCDQKAIRAWDGGTLDSLRAAMEPEAWEACDQMKAEHWLCGIEATVKSFGAVKMSDTSEASNVNGVS